MGVLKQLRPRKERSKALKTLLGEGYTPATSEIEPSIGQARGGSRIRALPLEVVGAYWLWQAARGNKTALSLAMSLLTENLERRFDAAFGVTRTETERNELLSQRVQELEQDIREAFWADDEARIKCDYYERWFRDHGIDPWKPQGRVMSLVNRRGSQKLDLLRKPGDINNKIF